MTAEQALVEVIDVLNELQVQYMVVGAFSSNYHGVGRSTKDIDLVISLEENNLKDITKKLSNNFQLDPQARFETITATNKFVYCHRDSPFEVEMFLLSDDEFDQSRFRRRQQVDLLGRRAYLPTAEDVVVMKLRWAMSRSGLKDSEDVRGVIAVSGNRMDWDYVYSWADRHGTRTLLDEIRRSIPTD